MQHIGCLACCVSAHCHHSCPSACSNADFSHTKAVAKPELTAVWRLSHVNHCCSQRAIQVLKFARTQRPALSFTAHAYSTKREMVCTFLPEAMLINSTTLGQRSGQYVHPVRVAPVPTLSGPQVTNPGYPGISQFIW